ncbi:unnamed protein product [Durusdinium trenchii]
MALEEGCMSLTESRCKHILQPLEDIDGERDGKDRGTFRLLKTVSIFLRLRGFQRGEPPFREMIIDGQPLVGKGCRALEQAVHLARTSARLRRIELINCHLDASEACVAEVIRLVKMLGTGSGSYFLEELNLSENSLGDDAAGRIIEAAVRDRCRRDDATALWLDLSVNRIKNPQSLFQKMEAWSSWAYREFAICLAQSNICSKEECKHSSLVHLPRFFEQEQKASQVVLIEREASNDASDRGEPLVMRPRVNLLPGPGAEDRTSRSRSPRGSSGEPVCAASAESSSMEEGEEEEFEEDEEEEEMEEDSDEDMHKGAKSRRRTSRGSSESSDGDAPMSQAQVEEKLERLLSKLKKTERSVPNGTDLGLPQSTEPAKPAEDTGPVGENPAEINHDAHEANDEVNGEVNNEVNGVNDEVNREFSPDEDSDREVPMAHVEDQRRNHAEEPAEAHADDSRQTPGNGPAEAMPIEGTDVEVAEDAALGNPVDDMDHHESCCTLNPD